MDFKAGQKFIALIPFSSPKTTRVHINSIVPSFHYSDRTFILYSCYGKHKQWWHEFMCTTEDMKHYIEMAKIIKK